VNGFESMNNFSTLTKANGYKDRQLINAIKNQDFLWVARRGGVKSNVQWTEAADMTKCAINDLKIEFDAEENFLAVASEECNEEVMRRFWKEWRGVIMLLLVLHMCVREQLIDDAKLEWQKLEPFYHCLFFAVGGNRQRGHSPEASRAGGLPGHVGRPPRTHASQEWARPHVPGGQKSGRIGH
jgi:hypothetical protein